MMIWMESYLNNLCIHMIVFKEKEILSKHLIKTMMLFRNFSTNLLYKNRNLSTNLLYNNKIE